MQIRYVRVPKMVNGKEEKHPVACLVGGHIDGETFVSVALCSTKDQFNKRTGRTIAIGRFKCQKFPNLNVNMDRAILQIVNLEIEQFHTYLEENKWNMEDMDITQKNKLSTT